MCMLAKASRGGRLNQSMREEVGRKERVCIGFLFVFRFKIVFFYICYLFREKVKKLVKSYSILEGFYFRCDFFGVFYFFFLQFSVVQIKCLKRYNDNKL